MLQTSRKTWLLELLLCQTNSGPSVIFINNIWKEHIGSGLNISSVKEIRPIYLHLNVFIFIHLFIHIHVYICTYIYIYGKSDEKVNCCIVSATQIFS